MTKFYAELVGRARRSILERSLSTVTSWGRWIYESAYANLVEAGPTFISRRLLAEIDHEKRPLRRMYAERIADLTQPEPCIRKVELKVKDEVAKVGKHPRIFTNYGAGCMAENELPEYIKVCLDEPFFWTEGGITMRVDVMAKPRPNRLDEMFTTALEAMTRDNHIHVMVYSDDSVYTGCIDGTPFAFNGDVSSNDSSQHAPAFGVVALMMAQFTRDGATALIRQCGLPFTWEDPDDRSNSGSIAYAGLFQGSGTVLTTILNHPTSCAIARTFLHVMAKSRNVAAVDLEYKAAAGMMGYEVTCDLCGPIGAPVPEKIQFLKRSPMRTTDGEWVPSINYGCLFRSFGYVDGDLTTKQVRMTPAEFANATDSELANRMFGGVVAGWKNEPATPWLEALRSRFSDGTLVSAVKSAIIQETASDRSHHVIDCDSLCTRYDISLTELHEFTERLIRLQVGQDVVCEASTAIYRVDYGL